MKWIKYRDHSPSEKGRYLCFDGIPHMIFIGVYDPNDRHEKWRDDGCCMIGIEGPVYWCNLEEIQTPKDDE